TDAVAIDAGYFHSLAARLDGTAWAWGQNHEGQLGDETGMNSAVPVLVHGLSDAVTVAGGAYHSLAISSLSLWPALVVAPDSGPPGTAVQMTGSGFAPNEIVWVGIERHKLGSIRADVAGAFSEAITIPQGTTTGSHTFHATGKSSGLYAEAIFEVT